MNDRRRDALRRADLFLASAARIISSVLEMEQDALDAVPENFQSGERYERAEEIADLLSDASDGLDEVMQKLCDASAK